MKLLPRKVESYGLSDTGLVRPNNEDVFRVIPEKQFYILADGMGGHNAGEIAAFKAVESMCASVKVLEKGATIEETCNLLRSAISTANETVYTLSHQNKAYSGMGTTLSCFLLHDDALIYAHVGDSRLYRKRQKLEQLTDDHSLRHVMLINEEQPAPDLPALLFRNVITRAIGTHPYVIPDIGVIPVQEGDIYLLCSDGLTDFVPEKCISETLNPDASLEQIAAQLVKLALEKGGNDNITVLLVKIFL
jgi:serine/threonine protein phosphatase PrpC